MCQISADAQNKNKILKNIQGTLIEFLPYLQGRLIRTSVLVEISLDKVLFSWFLRSILTADKQLVTADDIFWTI